MDSARPRERHRRMLATIVGLTIAVVGSACGSSAETEPSEFIVRVDSISGATAVSGGIAAIQQLWGTVGRSGCTAFKELRTTRAPSTMDVTVIGERVSGVTCLQDSVLLDGLVVRIEPLILDDFSLVVHQPDGSTLVRRIHGE